MCHSSVCPFRCAAVCRRHCHRSRCCHWLPAAGRRAGRGRRTRRRGRWRHAAGARGGRGRGNAGRHRPGDRTAGPPRSLARGAGACPRRRHPAATAVPRRQRCESRPAAVPDRCGAVRRRRAERCRRAGTGGSQRRAGPGAGRSLQAAGRGQCRQQAGIRHRRGIGQGIRSRRGRGPRRGDHCQHQPGLCHGDGADLGPHRPRAGHRRRTGRPGQ